MPYSPYVGNITIGVSDKQILAMLDNPLFRMVIPYHASGMLPIFAKLVGVDLYNDYTDYQNTTVRQYYDLDGNPVSELKNAKGETVKADTSYAFNAEIQKTKDAKIAANNYLNWCAQRHPVYDNSTLVGYATFNPKFSSSPYGTDFTRHENYYKLLEDFNTYDCITGESAVQGGVSMNFPSEANRLTEQQMAEYKEALRETGLFSEKDIEKYAKKADMTFKEIIAAEVGNRADYAAKQAPKWESTVKAVEAKLQKDYAREMQSSHETDVDTEADFAYNGAKKETEQEDKTDVRREESAEDFDRRTSTEVLRKGQKGQLSYAYRPHLGTLSPRAKAAREGLKKLGIPVFIYEKLESNRQGITTSHEKSGASTIPGVGVFIPFDADVDSMEIVGHEGFHFLATSRERASYTSVLIDNIDFASAEFISYQTKYVQEKYFEEEVGTDSDDFDLLTEEIFAYITGDIHSGDPKGEVHKFLRDYDAVKASWDDLIKKQAKDAFYSSHETDLDSDGNKLTKAQVEFFRDSKMRDALGRLIAMYHGTNSPNFTIFDPAMSDDLISLFFTSDPDVANTYTQQQDYGRDVDPYNLITKDSSAEQFNKAQEKVGGGLRVVKVTKDWIADMKQKARHAKQDYIVQAYELAAEIEKASRGDAAPIFDVYLKTVQEELAKGRIFGSDLGLALDKLRNNLIFLKNRKLESALATRIYDAKRNLDNVRVYEDAIVGEEYVGQYVYTETNSMVPFVARGKTDSYFTHIIPGTESEMVEKALDRMKWVNEHNLGNRYKVYLNLKNPYILDAGTDLSGKMDQITLRHSGYGDGWEVEMENGDDDITKYMTTSEFKSFVESAFDSETAAKINAQIEEDNEAYRRKWDDLDPDYVEHNIQLENVDINYIEPGKWNSLKFNGSENATTRDVAAWAKDNGYDGVIFKNVIDTGGFAAYKGRGPSTVAVAFDSNQVKSVDNQNPTSDPDIRYSEHDIDYSNRDLLANAFEGITKSSAEYKLVQEYKGRIKLLNEQEEKLSEINYLIRQLTFGGADLDDAMRNKIDGLVTKSTPETSDGDIIPNGTRVKANDRGNIGVVRGYDSNTEQYTVAFRNKSGLSKTVQLSADTIEPLRSKKPEAEVVRKPGESDKSYYKRLLVDEAEKIATKIQRQDRKLISLEASGPLRKLIEQERKKEAQKTKAHVKEIVQNKKLRAEQAELRHKIRKAVRDLDKLLNKGNKKTNVKEDMKGFVSKALELAD